MSTNETQDYGAQAAFIAEKGKTEDNVTTVTKGDYFAFSATQGLPREVLMSVAEHRSTMLGGMIHAGTERLVEAIREAKKNGDDPAGLSHEVRVATESGPLKMVLKARRDFPNPLAAQSGGPSTTTRYGVIEASLKLKSAIPKSPMAHAAASIKEAMGVKD